MGNASDINLPARCARLNASDINLQARCAKRNASDNDGNGCQQRSRNEVLVNSQHRSFPWLPCVALDVRSARVLIQSRSAPSKSKAFRQAIGIASLPNDPSLPRSPNLFNQLTLGCICVQVANLEHFCSAWSYYALPERINGQSITDYFFCVI